MKVNLVRSHLTPPFSMPRRTRSWVRLGLCSIGLLLSAESIVAADLEGPTLPQSEPAAPKVAETPEAVQTASLTAPAEPGTPSQLAKTNGAMRVRLKPVPKAAASENEFKPLLVSDQLTGWRILEGRADAWSSDGQTVRSNGGGAGWLLTEQTYSDFVLRFEYRLPAGGNSGVAIRCAEEGNPAFSGMEVQLLDDEAPKYAGLSEAQYTGSIYYRVAPHTKAPLRTADEWNTCEIKCVGPQVDIQVNGTPVNSISLRTPPGDASADTNSNDEEGRLPALDDRPPIGRIGLQSHAGGVEFRNLMLRDLGRKLPSGLTVVTLEPGTGDEAGAIDTVALHYIGQLADGTLFTNTYSAGDPIVVALPDVIAGWQEGVTGMKVGERRKLIVPAELGYGEEGVANLIPPGATLIFEVELCRVDR